jgi:hypothetical protein
MVDEHGPTPREKQVSNSLGAFLLILYITVIVAAFLSVFEVI